MMMSAERRCMPLGQWPAEDRRLWNEGLHTGGLFEVTGPGAHWSAHSQGKHQRGYGRWLTWLADTGQLDSAAPPGDRVTPGRIAAYLTALEATCAPYTRVSRIQDLHVTLRILAPQSDWRWLAELHATLRVRARPVRDKRRRLRPAAELVELGRQLMRAAEATADWSPRKRAVQFRDGLMIALLAHRPLRIKNFTAIRLGHQLFRQGERYWLVFGADETKTGQPWEAVFPETLLPYLARYLEHHRPVLLRGERGTKPAEIDALWVSEIGTQLELGALATRLCIHTAHAFGASLPPHWFRDAAATTIAVEDPKHVRDARLVLGHASLATTERHYNQARSLEASRRHQAVLTRLRGSVRRGPI
jgi:integrase/recombinase XerD